MSGKYYSKVTRFDGINSLSKELHCRDCPDETGNTKSRIWMLAVYGNFDDSTSQKGKRGMKQSAKNRNLKDV